MFVSTFEDDLPCIAHLSLVQGPSFRLEHGTPLAIKQYERQLKEENEQGIVPAAVNFRVCCL